MRLEASKLPLRTRRPFVTAHGRTDRVEALVARVDWEGHTGFGEAAPAPGITGESVESSRRQLQAWARDPAALEAALTGAEGFPGGHENPAARSAALVAWLDAQGRKSGVPMRRVLNLPEGRVESSITLSLGPPEDVLEEAAAHDQLGWPIFKVKLGGPDDEAVLRALRDRYPDRRLRVDANEGWTPNQARQRIPMLERLGVEFVEQPLPRALVDESAALARQFDLPIVLDEPLLDSASALDLVQREAGDGGNIKLAKCGGPFEARRIVKILRDAGWKVMMGCMIETRLGIAAAASFAGTLDYADLDGHVLLADDGCTGFDAPRGLIQTPERRGLGAEPAAHARLESLQA